MQINDTIISRNNPEWGTWKILENNSYGFVIKGKRGNTVLPHVEAKKFWVKAS